MKYVSKNSNLLIVLRPGIPGSHITGTAAKPMVSVRFKEGQFDTDDQEIIAMMEAHPAFNSDFVSTETTLGTDPYAYLRESVEPEHTVTEIKFGQPVGSGKPKKINFPPEVKQALQEQAMEMAKQMAKEMAPYMAAEFLQKALAEKDAASKADAPATEKRGPGRPKANQKTQAE